MSATLVAMSDFVSVLRLRVPRDIHPSAQVIIDDWLNDMLTIAEEGDMCAVVLLSGMVRDKIVDELRWEAVKGCRRAPLSGSISPTPSC